MGPHWVRIARAVGMYKVAFAVTRADENFRLLGFALGSLMNMTDVGGNVAKKLGNYVHDLRLSKNFHQELRFILLVKEYGGDGVYAVLLLWNWVAENHPSTGRLEKVKGEHIHALCCISEEQSQEFINDLMEFEFLAQGEDGIFYIPNWRDDQPYVAQAEERSEVGRVAAEKRWGPRDTEGNRARVENGGNGSALGTQCSNTNSNTNLKSPPAPPRGGQTQLAPVSEIVALYREALPELSEPREETEKLGKDITARWKSKPERQSLEWWAEFFALVRERPYLMGEGKGDWRASLGWLVAKGNMDKVLGGEYPTRAKGGGPPAVKSYSLEESERMRLAAEAAEAADTAGAPPG